MNKYQDYKEAIEDLDWQINECKKYGHSDIYFAIEEAEDLRELLKILVEKATPKKIVREGNRHYCPNCDELLLPKKNALNMIINGYCPYCGQYLDWSNYE